MNHSLEHRFQAALAIACHHSPPQPIYHWYSATVSPSTPASLSAAVADTALMAQPDGPLQLSIALLPMLLQYWDDESILRQPLSPIAPSTTTTIALEIALEIAWVIQQLMAVILREQPLNLTCLLSLVGPKLPHLSPYLSAAAPPHHRDMGLAQRRSALSTLGALYPKSEDHEAAAAIALALQSVVQLPEQGPLAYTRLSPHLPASAVAIAGALSGLYQGLAGLSLQQYQRLEAALPARPNLPEGAIIPSAAALAQQLTAGWAGALSTNLGPAAIAPINILRL